MTHCPQRFRLPLPVGTKQLDLVFQRCAFDNSPQGFVVAEVTVMAVSRSTTELPRPAAPFSFVPDLTTCPASSLPRQGFSLQCYVSY